MILFVLFPLGCFFLVSLAIGVGLQALLIYVGAQFAAWSLFAIVLPLLTGSMAPSEIANGFRSRWRAERFYEGEPLPKRALGYQSSTRGSDADWPAA